MTFFGNKLYSKGIGNNLITEGFLMTSAIMIM